MRILTRYILREVISYAMIGAGIFTFLFFMVNLERILELVVRNSAPLPSVMEIFAFTLPKTLTLTIPMGVLVGVLIGLSRLAADSEITAMRATGMGSWAFARIATVFVVAAGSLAILNNVVIAPRAASALGRLEERLKSSQASFEVQPRVFYEDFPNSVLYVQDTSSSKGAAVWKGVFLADVGTSSSPKITLAREGVVVGEGTDRLHLRLIHGSQHETSPQQPGQYSISTFGQSDVFLPITTTAPTVRLTAPSTELPTSALIRQAKLQKDPAAAAEYLIEFHRRWAMAIALLRAGAGRHSAGPLGKKGGQEYRVRADHCPGVYLLSGGPFRHVAGPPGKSPRGRRNVALRRAVLLRRLSHALQVDRFPRHLPNWREGWRRARGLAGKNFTLPRFTRKGGAFERMNRRRHIKYGRFPMILDELILQEFALYLGMVLCTFLVLLLVFTFFELLRDIVRNHISDPGRGISPEPDPLPALQDVTVQRASGRADDLWPDAEIQRDHRHEGHRH